LHFKLVGDLLGDGRGLVLADDVVHDALHVDAVLEDGHLAAAPRALLAQNSVGFADVLLLAVGAAAERS